MSFARRSELSGLHDEDVPPAQAAAVKARLARIEGTPRAVVDSSRARECA